MRALLLASMAVHGARERIFWRSVEPTRVLEITGCFLPWPN